MRQGSSRIVGVSGFESLVLLLLLGCSDQVPTSPVNDFFNRSVIVSGPIFPLAVPASAVIPPSPDIKADPTVFVVYVSLPPGTVPGTDKATIRDLATQHSVAVSIIDGGFDPVAFPAKVGDTLAIEARSHSVLVAATSVVVPRRRPPIVVRTEPPKGKTDVPLNTRIEVIFSEPVDPKSLSGSVVLFHAGAPVPGSAVSGAADFIADFVPDAVLAPQTEYELEVGTGVHTPSGVALDATVKIPFTTMAANVSVARVEIDPWSSWIVVGDTLRLKAIVRDAAGDVVTSQPVTWSSSSASTASVSSSGLVTALGLGRAGILATSGGAVGGAGVTVQAPGPTQPAFGRIAFVSDRDGPAQLYVVNVDGSGLTQLTHDGASYSRPAWSPDGTRIAVVRNGVGVVVMQDDGTGATLVAPGGVSPAWSLDGARIRYVVNGGTEIDEVTTDGAQNTKLCSGVFGGQLYRGDHVDWSPDRKTAAFEMETYTAPGDDPMVTTFVNDDHCTGAQIRADVGFAPAWAPDGQRLAGVTFGPGYTQGGITWIVNGIWTSDGTAAFLSEGGYMTVHWPNRITWSPDGAYIAFVREPPPLPDGQLRYDEIWITPANGTGIPHRLGPSGQRGEDPAWSPR